MGKGPAAKTGRVYVKSGASSKNYKEKAQLERTRTRPYNKLLVEKGELSARGNC